MDPMSIGALLGGAGQLAGGIAGLFGGSRSNYDPVADRIAQQNLAFQQAAATQGIRWKVADAKAAGIHPLFALGAPTFNPSPVSYQGAQSSSPDIGSALSSMGQGVGRAVAATQTKEERLETASQMVMQRQAIERGDLQNELLRAQIASMNARTMGSAQIGPGFPKAGDYKEPMAGSQGDFKIEPTKVTSQSPQMPGTAAGPATPGVNWERSPSGVVARPSNQQMDMDITNPEYLVFLLKNRLLGQSKPSDYLLQREFPGAKRWEFHGGEWQPRGGSYPERKYKY